jgi:hypothetical protein
MNRTLLTAGLAVLGSAVLWMVALAQLAEPVYTLPDRSTQTEMPGP